VLVSAPCRARHRTPGPGYRPGGTTYPTGVARDSIVDSGRGEQPFTVHMQSAEGVADAAPPPLPSRSASALRPSPSAAA